MKVGIIGIGNMGKNHVRLVREHSHLVTLEGIFDPDEERVKSMGLMDVMYSSEEALMESVDAVIVAAPSSMHKKIALLAAEKNVHLLLEKPLALSYDDGKQIVDAYEKTDRVLMVGHVERFNPVVTEMEKIIEKEKVIGIEIDRCSPMDRRISDTDVIYDLMIHDVDILLNSLNHGASLKNIAAIGTNSYSEKYMDYVQGIFKFDNNVVASIVSSRATEGKIRSIRVHCENCCVQADLLHKTLQVSRKTQYNLDVGYNPVYTQENIIEQIFVPNVESLKAEQMHFFDCINKGLVPKTNGQDSLKSLRALDCIKADVYSKKGI